MHGGYLLEYLHSQLHFPLQESVMRTLGCWGIMALEPEDDMKHQGGAHFPQYS